MTKNEVIDQLKSLLGHCKTMRESGEIWARDCEALRIAIAALRGPTREQVEAWTKCNECTSCKLCLWNKTQKCNGCKNEFSFNPISNFCPRCGRPLTDKAVDIVMKRLEALHENDR